MAVSVLRNACPHDGSATIVVDAAATASPATWPAARSAPASSPSPATCSSFSYGDRIACPFPTVTAAFYHQAALHPSLTAVHGLSSASSATPRELTYRQLAGHAQALALRLRGLGLRPGQQVPLVVKRGVEMVVVIWAVLSCGAQYVPLDGGIVPDSNICHVIEQSAADLVLCLSSTEHRVRSQLTHVTALLVDQSMASEPTGSWSEEPLDLASAESGCYVIYTSGTTGKPKGVDVTHKNVANLVCLAPGGLGIKPGMCVGQVLNISFDMAAWEIFACLCNGGTLVRGSQWERTMRELHVLICTSTILSKFRPADYPLMQVVATAGEPTSQDIADAWASHATYWNCCGPTEMTIVNTMSRHVAGQPVSIGRPTPNNNVYILDDAGRLVAPGVTGVMWAGGHGISRGYVGLAARTQEAYRVDPFAKDGSRIYCTGDLGRWKADGTIDILGRSDDQVEIKGFRVELDGVSASLASAPGVSRAATVLVGGEMHGFVVPVGQDAAALLEHARRLQPYYAIPARIHQLAAFPTTANGKIDKQALRALAAVAAASDCGTLAGYSLVVSNAGDWTKACIRSPPTRLWVRGLPTCGVMCIATLFNRVVIATGSGIGPLLGHIAAPSCPTQLIWSTPRPESTFGKPLLDTIRRSIPDAVIHDTSVKGRPDLVKMGYNLVRDFGAEAVIIANEKITKKVVYGLETRGVPAYGAIWDS